MTHLLIVDNSAKGRERLRAIVDDIEGATYEIVESGSEALQRLSDGAVPIDVVLSDLRIPDMGGMELLDRVVAHFPLIPVVVVTSRSSISNAVEALKRGAAYYVPKNVRSEALRDAIEKMIHTARDRRRQADVMEAVSSHRQEFWIGNDRRVVPLLWNQIQTGLVALGFLEPQTIVRTGVAFQEAVMNAIVHGNLGISSSMRDITPAVFEEQVRDRSGREPFCDRRVQIVCDVSRERLEFEVTDEGTGFDPCDIPDPTLPENLLRASGRGLLLMKHFMDEVCYNARGNAVTLVKYCPSVRKQNAPDAGTRAS